MEKSYTWLKHNWKIPFIIIYTFAVYALSRRNTDALKDVMESQKEAHKNELKVLSDTHNDQILKLKGLQKQYEDTIFELQDRFKKEEKDLTEKQTKEIKKIVIKSKGNPEEIKRKIENEFGIKFKE